MGLEVCQHIRSGPRVLVARRVVGVIEQVEAAVKNRRLYSVETGKRLDSSCTTCRTRKHPRGWTHYRNELRLAPARLSVFRIGADGRLELVRKHDELNGKLQW